MTIRRLTFRGWLVVLGVVALAVAAVLVVGI